VKQSLEDTFNNISYYNNISNNSFSTYDSISCNNNNSKYSNYNEIIKDHSNDGHSNNSNIALKVFQNVSIEIKKGYERENEPKTKRKGNRI